jgi:hypothetical protein
MSKYLDNKELFMEPKTTQYGSHMVMTNVVKNTKKKYINIDTRFRDEYNSSQTANYNITLPERLTEVKLMTITNIEIPISFYNISSSNGNHVFKIKNTDTDTTTIIDLSDNNYTTNVFTSINTKLHDVDSDLSLNYSNNKAYFSSKTNNYEIDFAIDSNGNFDKYQFCSKLGWLLGFRDVSYNISSGSSTYSDALYDLNGTRYLYLAIDEFTRGNQHSFISPLPKSLINKNIIARISLDSHSYEFGSIYSANRMHGTLISDFRNYSGKADLQKLNIQLLNEYGNPVNLNGLDFSFSMEVEHE